MGREWGSTGGNQNGYEMSGKTDDGSGRKKRILVLDDTKPIRILILKSFEKQYDVYLESDGHEALDTIRNSDPRMDLVIMDFDMPKLNGYQVVRLLKNIDPDIPVIMVSGSLDEGRLQKVRQAGVSTILAKPVNLKRLREEIERVLGPPPAGTAEEP